ncbi:MAG: peptidylprolyl isomerase [Thermoplasmatota archaeon]
MTSKKRTERKRANEMKNRKTAKSRTPLIMIVILIGIIAVAAGIIFMLSQSSDDGTGNQDTGEITENPIAVLDTSMGTIKIELYMDKAPITVGNFLNHAKSGYYNGTIFHRVMSNFMIQGGDPLGTGFGGHAAEYHEGYGDSDNPDSWVIPDEFRADLSNIRGTISMANKGDNTGGSQFFINVVDNTHLDYNKEPTTSKHAVFGVVVEGMTVVDAISNVDTNPSTNKPINNITINSITIEEKK